MANQLIALCGYAGVGKDETARGLDGWARVSFAQPIRDDLEKLNPLVGNGLHLRDALRLHGGWDDVKRIYPHVRYMMQVFGTEICRARFGENCWVEIAERKIEAADGNVVVTDLRFPNEGLMIRRLGGRVVRIINPSVEAVNAHCSEHQTIHDDCQIINDSSIANLHAQIREIANWSRKEVQV